MFKHTMEFDISNLRSTNDAKARVWKINNSVSMIVTVVNGIEGIPFAVDSYDMPRLIQMNGDGDIKEKVKEFSNLPISA